MRPAPRLRLHAVHFLPPATADGVTAAHLELPRPLKPSEASQALAGRWAESAAAVAETSAPLGGADTAGAADDWQNRGFAVCVERGCLVVSLSSIQDGAATGPLLEVPLLLAEVKIAELPTTKEQVIVIKVAAPCGLPLRRPVGEPAAHLAPRPPSSAPSSRPTAGCLLRFRRSLDTLVAVDDSRGTLILQVEPDGGAAACEGERCPAQQVLEAMGACGAVRMDLKQRLKLGDLLGQGLFAEVFRAEVAASTGSPASEVAVKILKCTASCSSDEDDVGDAGLQDVLRKELSVLAAVQGHPNVLRLHGAFQRRISGKNFRPVTADSLTKDRPQDPGLSQWCFAMENCLGGELLNIIRKDCFSEDTTKMLMKGVLSALEHIHAVGVIHRDIKTENILLRSNGEPVVADFGLSCRASDGEELRRTCGSPGFVPPEVIAREGWQARSDIFSAGCVMFVALTQRTPFRGPDAISTLRRTVSRPLSLEYPGLMEASSECRDFVSLLLSKTPEVRPSASAALVVPWLGVPRLGSSLGLGNAATAQAPPSPSRRWARGAEGPQQGEEEGGELLGRPAARHRACAGAGAGGGYASEGASGRSSASSQPPLLSRKGWGLWASEGGLAPRPPEGLRPAKGSSVLRQLVRRRKQGARTSLLSRFTAAWNSSRASLASTSMSSTSGAEQLTPREALDGMPKQGLHQPWQDAGPQLPHEGLIRGRSA